MPTQEVNTPSKYSLVKFNPSDTSDSIIFTYKNNHSGSIVTLEIGVGTGEGSILLEKDGRLSGLMIDELSDYIYHNADILN